MQDKTLFWKLVPNLNKLPADNNSISIDYQIQFSEEKDEILINSFARAFILSIIENILNDSIFHGINKEKCKENVINLIESETNENYNSLNFSTIKERLRKILMIELLSNLASDFSKEERKKFQKEIKRRPLFK